jgi:hypothetical protein
MHLLRSAHGGFAQHHEFVGGSDCMGQHGALLGFSENNLTEMPNILVWNGALHQRSRPRVCHARGRRGGATLQLDRSQRVLAVEYRLLVRHNQPKRFLKVQRNNFECFPLGKHFIAACFQLGYHFNEINQPIG